VEEKYLVKRRDGTVAEWRSFAPSARDPDGEDTPRKRFVRHVDNVILATTLGGILGYAAWAAALFARYEWAAQPWWFLGGGVAAVVLWLAAAPR